MSDRIEDQIRSFTAALYATATPVDELAPVEVAERSGTETGPVQVFLEPSRRAPLTRRLGGPAVGLVAAVAVLLAALPFLLLTGDGEPAGTRPTPSTIAIPVNSFVGVWIGQDAADASSNTLIVEDGTAIYQESGIRACEAYFGQFVEGSASGPITIDGNTLRFVGTLYCSLEAGNTVHPDFENVDWVFDYDPTTGTLTLTRDPNTHLSRPGNQ